MSRRRRAVKRPIVPDPKFNNALAARFINCMMKAGKKSVSERTFYSAIDMVTERSDQQGLDIFLKAVENCKPMVITKSRRVGSQTLQIPLEVRPEERTTRAIKWIIRFARERSERTMADRLANELIAAANGEGGAVRARDEVHRMADANKAFAHYRF
ncbi:MAG TPA: 30S ribosomal protein S7 [Candidatus Latescibacteria bacterium]|jgi:small subunit ribosomal protein S7|nr:30S ribosomal protein S7 [Gemmatimonadota bacterium]MDP7364825.1 30S ribosomal protein S7 [Candidatus Latescibacterota bacterium]HJN29507.1 30S ribosomal protein S7 [Candidatus Latescibacterota bacterium]|tara:strand:- start:427 stop:897 length:471 start_codon:yes stop_codon:yes gene_type:complete